LTRDFSSDASCSRLVSASFVRASSALTSVDALVPPALPPGRSFIAMLSLPAFGGTSSRRSFAFEPDAVDAVELDAVFDGVFGAGGGVAVSATSVGFAASPPRQSSICACTAAAASLADPAALI
jgi:hypothetical protein